MIKSLKIFVGSIFYVLLESDMKSEQSHKVSSGPVTEHFRQIDRFIDKVFKTNIVVRLVGFFLLSSDEWGIDENLQLNIMV